MSSNSEMQRHHEQLNDPENLRLAAKSSEVQCDRKAFALHEECNLSCDKSRLNNQSPKKCSVLDSSHADSFISVQPRRSYNKEYKSRESHAEEAEEALNEVLLRFYGFSCIEELTNFCFNKKYSFAEGLETDLYTYAKHGEQRFYQTEKWNSDQLHELQALKRKLNCVKAELNDYDLNEWHKHTRSTNPADLVIRRLKSKLKEEFVTQAWCKFYELISVFNLIPEDAVKSQSFYTVHLCEAPGAFVVSLNHYLKSHYAEMEWHWIANSLNPYYEGNTPTQMINDDRFMIETIRNWDFGPDMTGDITRTDYPDYLKTKKCGENLPHLVTADGSFDCQDKPEEQENIVSWLLLKETLIALRILRKGGNFLMKMFTFFECDTICLLYLLASMFGSMNVMKPVTSKEGNSEVYVICQEFKGYDVAEPLLRDLFLITPEQHRNFAMFPYEYVHRNFIEEVEECARQYASYQTKIIERNIKLFHDRSNVQLRKLFKCVQEQCWRKFDGTYKVKPIAVSHHIVQFKEKSKVRRSTTVIEKREARKGSHADRVRMNNSSKEEIFKQIIDELNSLGVNFWVKEIRMPDVNVRIEDFKIRYCKPIERIKSSQFCHGAFIRIRNTLIDTISIVCYNPFTNDSTYLECDCKVCDFRSINAQNENYSETQIISFRKIYDALFELKNGDDLILIDLPLLTQFNVNVLCLLKQMFEQIEFRNAITLHLRSVDTEERDEWKIKLDEISRHYSKSQAVLSFLPLVYITGTKNSLYSWLVDINNVRAYNHIVTLINSNEGNNG